MPSFQYDILDASGGRDRGILDAEDLVAAAAVLKQGGGRILALEPTSRRGAKEAGGTNPRDTTWSRISAHFPVTSEEKAQAFGHLAMMTRSGLSLSNALRLIAPETPHLRLRDTLADIAGRIERGLPFSEALAAHSSIFPPIVSSIVSSSEESGEMADGLDRVCEYLRFWSELRRKVLQSLTYPAIVVVLAVGVTALLVSVFIPKVESFVSRGGRTLPPTTQFLFDLSHFFQSSWPWLLAALILLGTGGWALLRRPAWRLRMERIVLRIPMVGSVWQAALLAQVCGLLSVLLQSGTSLVRAIEVSAGTLTSHYYRRIFLNALESVVRGLTLRHALEQPGMPGTLLGVVSAGEESGDLPRSFRELESYYARRLSSRLAILVTLIEPALILFVGGIVALVYVALFSAVLSLVR